MFGLLNEIFYLSGERILLTAGGDPLYFQGSLATPQQNVYQLNFHVDDDSGEAGHRFRQEGDRGSVRDPARYRSEATLAS